MRSAAFHAAPWSPLTLTPEGEIRWLTLRAGFRTESPSQRFVYCIKLTQPLGTNRTTLSAFRLVGPPANTSISAWLHVSPVLLDMEFPDCYTALRWIEEVFFDA